MFKVLTVICSVVALSNGSTLKTPNQDIKSFYKIEEIAQSEEPIIIRHFNNAKSTVLQYKVSPNDRFEDYDSKDYVIVNSEKEAFDVVPYGVYQQLDKIKYMILWLNLYCEMHPDCDKSVLDKELRKLVSAVKEAKEDKFK